MFKAPKSVATVCDTACRAQQLRESALYKAALQGPRI
jgi:hypothetical protein